MVDVAAEAEARRVKKEVKKEKKQKREEKNEREMVRLGCARCLRRRGSCTPPSLMNCCVFFIWCIGQESVALVARVVSSLAIDHAYIPLEMKRHMHSE